MVQNLFVRIIARLGALGALFGAWVLLLICCVSVPVRNFNFLQASFADTSSLELGMWGWCYHPVGGAAQAVCSGTSVGYALNITNLPRYSANPGAVLNITEKPITAAMIFFPLATGSTSLANLLSLVPVRWVTLGCIGLVFLSIGASAISFVVALASFAPASARIAASFNPTTIVRVTYGNCLWFALAALVSTVGAFLFLLLALEPAKRASDEEAPSRARDKRDGEKWEPERRLSISGLSKAAQAGERQREESIRSARSKRSSHRRVHGTGAAAGRRHRRDETMVDDEDLYDYEPTKRRSGSQSRRRQKQVYSEDSGSEEEEEDYYSQREEDRPASRASQRKHRARRELEEEVEEEPPRRRRSHASKRSRRSRE